MSRFDQFLMHLNRFFRRQFVNIYFNDFLDFSFGVFSSPIPVSKIPGDASLEGENEFLFLGRKCDKRNKNNNPEIANYFR
jgi:hypothetical protein